MELKVNQASVLVRSTFNGPVSVLWRSSECYKCDPIELIALSAAQPNGSAIVSTFYTSVTSLRLGSDKHLPSNCTIPSFENKGIYNINVSDEGSCLVTILSEPKSIYVPCFGALLLILLLDFFQRLVLAFRERRKMQAEQSSLEENENAQQSRSRSTSSSDRSSGEPVIKSDKSRVQSLDVFRGLCLFLMIFVNYGGGKLWFFEHIPWNGMTFADLLFPWFVWIMGLSLAITMRSLRRKCVPRSEIFLRITSRSIKLFVLGLILNSKASNDISTLRIPGVLQRFAISYFAVATMHMFFARATEVAELGKWRKIQDVLLYWQEWIFMILVVVIHTLLTFYLEIPGCPKGYLGPGGRQEEGRHYNCTGGAAGYIDRVLLGTNHLYAHPSSEEIYGSKQHFDPEGTLGCLTSIFLTFLGLQAGKILLTFKSPQQRLSRWLSWGVLLGLLAGILCNFSKEGGWIPINKNLWSLSYVLCTAGLAFLLLSLFYVLIDISQTWSGMPFAHLGLNSILIYVGHALVTDMLPWFWSGSENHWRYVAMNLGGVYLWVLTAYALHKNRVYLAL